MRIEKIRVSHFQCIADTGEIDLDERLTVLVGQNESGKSAILKALERFNPGSNFEKVDLCTLSGIRNQLDTKRVNPSEVEMVALWIVLSEQDRVALGFPEELTTMERLKIVKTYDNEYKVLGLEAQKVPSPSTPAGRAKVVKLLEEVKAKIEKAYRGRIKHKEPWHHFVWVERHEGEADWENLVLFPEWAPTIWDSLKTGDWIQVTNIAEDPLGRNARALNAGLAIDVVPIVSTISDLARGLGSTGKLNEQTFQQLEVHMRSIPDNHPLTAYLNPETLKEIARLSHEAKPSEPKILDIKDRIIGILPEFVYVQTLSEMSSEISIRNLGGGSPREPELLLNSLFRLAGLTPSTILESDPIDRKKIFDEKSGILSKRIGEYWFNKNMRIEVSKDGQKVAIWVNSDGSIDPPSRRSRGLSSFISLFAVLAEMSAKRNVVLLLDDPAVYLHPVAQKEMLPLLESQPFQIIMATHLPFMIDPSRADRVRVLVRGSDGTRIEQEWSAARESLVPVWGSVLQRYEGRAWLLLEGKTDAIAYSRLSNACKEEGRASLPDGLCVVPTGGSTLPFFASQLLTHGIQFIAIPDGDKDGESYKQQILKMPGIRSETVFTLAELGLGKSELRLQDLFHGDYDRATSKTVQVPLAFDKRTMDNFEKIFERVKKAFVELQG